jgi:AcrR family transcriptional regulator
VARRPRRAGADPRDTILRTAREEFAARGFAAARVETLARRARVNKALIYYYFGSKLGLYRHVIGDAISGFTARMRAVIDGPGAAEDKVRRWVAELAAHFTEHPTMPLIMLRELADGGSHFDADMLRELTIFVPLMRRLIGQGQAEGLFGDADPIALHFVLMGSTLLFTSNAPIRRRIRQLGLAQPPLETAPFVRHLQQVALRSLRKDLEHVDSIR